VTVYSIPKAGGRPARTGWNDGHGFVAGPDVQGVGYTTNGGASWTDAGSPPKTGSTITAWSSDPSVTVNPGTGEFWFCALVDIGATSNGVGVIKATFPGGVLTWATPVVARSVSKVSVEWPRRADIVQPGEDAFHVR